MLICSTSVSVDGFIARGAADGGPRVVNCIADRWGVARDGGTRVWFELDRGADQASPGKSGGRNRAGAGQ